MTTSFQKSIRVLILSVLSALSILAIMPRTSHATSSMDEWEIDLLPELKAANSGGDVWLAPQVCISVNNCAVGGYYSSIDTGYQSWVASSTNGIWTTNLLPEIELLNNAGDASVNSIACPSTGNCVIGGSLRSNDGNRNAHQPWVATQTNGSWTPALFPDIQTLNSAGDATVNSIACPSIGNCVVSGSYYQENGNNDIRNPWAATLSNGTWTTETFPDIETLNTEREANTTSLTCSSNGNCIILGQYRNHGQQSWVATLSNGTWTTETFPDIETLNTGGNSRVNGVACPSTGNCFVSGDFFDNIIGHQPWVATWTNGTWTTQLFPDIQALNTRLDARVNSMTCPSDGNCYINGFYSNNDGPQPWVGTLANGIWTTETFPDIQTLNTGGNAQWNLMTCPSNGNCLISGYYRDNFGFQPWAATLTNGTWTTDTFPDIQTLNTGYDAQVTAMSCQSNGNCLVGGFYNSSNAYQPWAARLVDGTWTIETFPDIQTLNTADDARVDSIICTSATNCVLNGYYHDNVGTQMWIASVSTTETTSTTIVPTSTTTAPTATVPNPTNSSASTIAASNLPATGSSQPLWTISMLLLVGCALLTIVRRRTIRSPW